MKKIILVLLIATAQLFYAQDDANDRAQKTNLSLIPISVTIGGDFIVTGSFTAFKTQRLDHFISTLYVKAQETAISGLNQLETIKQIKKETEKFALRGITLKRATGENVKIDLLKFRLTGDFKYNPYLMNDDVIVFPSFDSEYNIVDVSGSVNKPTKFQFVEGDRLSDAILFAGGLNKAYDNINKAEISRLNNTGSKEESVIVNISDDAVLKSGDRIRILSDENKRKDYKALVLGEVKFPGYVYLTADGSSLNDVIAKAGGFNQNADLTRAELVRNYSSLDMLKKYALNKELYDNPNQLIPPEIQLSMKQQKELLELSRVANITEEDSLSFKIDSQLYSLGTGNYIDFTKINDSSSEESNFIVRDGDLILIPYKHDYVYVFGQVANSGMIKYYPEQNYHYYIDRAGGKTELAKEDDEVVLIKQRDKNWITKEKEKLKVEAGDYIYVPKDTPKSFNYYLQRVSNIAGIVGSLATVILLFSQLSK